MPVYVTYNYYFLFNLFLFFKLGISTQIVIYGDDKSWEDDGPFNRDAKDDCQNAKELNVLQTFYIQVNSLFLIRIKCNSLRIGFEC